MNSLLLISKTKHNKGFLVFKQSIVVYYPINIHKPCTIGYYKKIRSLFSSKLHILHCVFDEIDMMVQLLLQYKRIKITTVQRKETIN